MVIEFQCGEDKMINFMLCIFATIKKKYLSKNNGTNRTSKLIFQTNSNGLLYLIRMSSLGPKVWSSPKSAFLALLSDAPRLCLQSQQQFPFWDLLPWYAMQSGCNQQVRRPQLSPLAPALGIWDSKNWNTRIPYVGDTLLSHGHKSVQRLSTLK